ncbi:hypothetical protein CBR_g38405 [Chara braunii]|uniref:Aspergillus nuclease S1 n=1 Tax=Chara braunii TaxID=69332 RepID=A0A388JNH9_CHABU|nr:hypothetical protein CBR_g38405 [Chara braunii]|eukprot:GBG59379.1 hypothetical protein CBR_g38405 [Chara braunii]
MGILKKNFTQWALEGRDYAIQYVYKGISGTEIDVEANDYIDSVKNLSKRLIALAGYRLAFLLNNLFVAPPDREKYVIPGAIEIVKNCTNGGAGARSSSGSNESIGTDSRTVSFVAAGLGFAVVIGIAAVAVFRSDKKPKHKYKTLEMAGRENRYTLRNPRPAYQDEEEPEEDSS